VRDCSLSGSDRAQNGSSHRKGLLFVPERDRLSDYAALLAAIIVFLAVKSGLDFAGAAAGIPSYIDYGETVVIEHPLYDEERDGSSTDFGMFGFAAGAMLAWRAYYMVRTRSMRGGTERRQRRVWAAWLIGFIAYTVLAIGIDLAGIHGAIAWYGKLAVAAAVFFSGRWIFERIDSKSA
jgi:hypothetical protein